MFTIGQIIRYSIEIQIHKQNRNDFILDCSWFYIFLCFFNQINYDVFVKFMEFILSMEFITSVGDSR